MNTLKKMVHSHLVNIASIMIVLVLLISLLSQVITIQNNENDNAEAAFYQIEQILDENDAELQVVQDEYEETCLLNAETVAYLLEHNKNLVGNVEQSSRIAEKMERDGMTSEERIRYVDLYNPDVLDEVEEFRKLAKKLQVDEIHIFNRAGVIFTGTHPRILWI